MSNKRSFHDDENDETDCWKDLLQNGFSPTTSNTIMNYNVHDDEIVTSPMGGGCHNNNNKKTNRQDLMNQNNHRNSNNSGSTDIPNGTNTGNPIIHRTQVLAQKVRRTGSSDSVHSGKGNSSRPETATVLTSNKQLYDEEYQHSQSLEYNSDDEPPPVFLDWRTDPIRNFSDWTINVIITTQNCTTIRHGEAVVGEGNAKVFRSYHVHKNVLVVESEYFQKLFELDQTGSYSESKTSTSTIELVEVGATSFEALLDYMYRPGEPNLTTDNAVAVHHFGEYFGMKRLRWLARQFWKKDLSANTIATYYKHAGIFLDDKVMQAVKRECCSVPYLIEAGSSGLLLDVPDPQLWFFLLKNFNGTCSIPMSAFVTEYCDRHQVDPVTFVQMTAKSVLPEIFFDVAQQLVELERKILGDSVEITCLQLRCITALAKDWKRIDVSSDSFAAFLSEQSPKFSAELFKQSMLAARTNRDDDRP